MPGPFLWNERAGRYINATTKRFVPWTQVRDSLDRAIDSSAAAMRQASQSLRDGTMRLTKWRSTMQTELKNMHLAAASLAKGGHKALTLADFGKVGATVKKEYGYLERLTAQIQSGAQPLDGRFLQRAEQYTKAGRATFEAQRRVEAIRRGQREMRSVRHASDSCPGCINQEALGWIALDDPRFIVPGSRQCRANCKCSLIFR